MNLPGFIEVDLGRAVCGVYVLFDGDEIVYVGKSTDIYSRIRQHRFAFDRVIIREIDRTEIDAYESALIRAFRPKNNTAIPRPGTRDAEIFCDLGLEPAPLLQVQPVKRKTRRDPGLLGVLIRAARERIGKSQETLAAELGVSQPSVAWWESGHRFPRDLGSIATALEIDAAELSAAYVADRKRSA